MNQRSKNLWSALGALALVAPQLSAGTFTADFNTTTVPDGTFLNSTPPPNETTPLGSGIIEDGVLKLTKNVGGQSGSFVIADFDAGEAVYGFHLTAKVRIGGGSNPPADGMGITFSPGMGINQRPGHDGVGSGITFTFDQWDNGAGEGAIAAPSIDVRVGGTVIATKKVTFNDIRTGDTWVPLDLLVTPAGAISMSFKGETIFTNLYVNTYEPLYGANLGLHANTGGSTENYWIDDLSVTTFTTPEVGVGNGPVNQTLINGATLAFNPFYLNADGATFEWQKNGLPIPDAIEPTYSVPVTLADNGAKYTLKVTGPNNTVTRDATITVVDIPLPATPTVSFNFDDGLPPEGTFITENAHFPTVDGGEIPGTLHITDAANDQNGMFVVEDVANGEAVHGLTASFKLQMFNNGGAPADGFSFNYAPDIAGTGRPESENGLGTGLVVGFDTYDNNNFEAPAVEVRFGGVLIAQVKPLIEFLMTGETPTDVIIRLENDGTLDVVYKGVVVFNNLLIPNFTSLTGSRAAIGARTGGASAAVWIDDFNLTVNTTPGPVRIVSAPRAQYVLPGETAAFSVGVNDNNNVTYQWFRDGAAVNTATAADYSLTPVAGDSGAAFTVVATKAGLSVTSAPVALTVGNITPTVSFDFNSGIPAGTVRAGTASAGYISDTGGVNDSGVLHLTDAVNGQSGAFVVLPLLAGAELSGLNVAFDVRVGGGSANNADGWNFNFDPGLPESNGTGPEGTGNGLRVVIDLYDNLNGGGEAPAAEIWWRNAIVAQLKLTKAETKTDVNPGEPIFKPFYIKLTPEGKVDVAFGGRVLFKDVQLPNYAPTANGKIGFYAVTGGLNENIWIDNLRIEAIKSLAPLRIVAEPSDVLLLGGQTATFNVAVSDPEGVTFQWFRNGAAIQNATGTSYTTPALAVADSGARYSVTATRSGTPLTSREAIATVVAPITISGVPNISFNFDDGFTPEGAVAHGRVDDAINFYIGGFATTDGGVNNSGTFHLTDSINGQSGSLYVPDFNALEPVSGFTAAFQLRIGNGTARPADGVSFSWSSLLHPEDPAENLDENGSNTGLVIAFDTYDNGDAEAPAIDILYKGNVIATHKLPIASLVTDAYALVVIRVESDGTVDVQHNGNAIFNNVALPGYAPLSGGHFAIAGRTGGENASQWIDDLQIATISGPVLTFSAAGAGAIQLEWNSGTLQSAPAITGPWTDLAAEVSPATLPTTGDMRFFRVAR